MISRVPAILDVKKLKSIDLRFEFSFCISIKQWLDIYGKFLLTLHWNYFFHELLYLNSLSAPSERIHLLPVEFEHANIIYILKSAIREYTAQQTQNNSVNHLQLWKNHNKTKEEWVFLILARFTYVHILRVLFHLNSQSLGSDVSTVVNSRTCTTFLS